VRVRHHERDAPQALPVLERYDALFTRTTMVRLDPRKGEVPVRIIRHAYFGPSAALHMHIADGELAFARITAKRGANN
jgi:hypothetical protein